MRVEDVTLSQIGEVACGRPAVDDHHRAALDKGSADGVDEAQRPDAIGYRDRGQSLGSRVSVCGITGFEITGGHHRRNGVGGCPVEQCRAVERGHPEQMGDALLLQPCQHVVDDGDCHGGLPCAHTFRLGCGRSSGSTGS